MSSDVESYCRECRAVVGEHPWVHDQDVHPEKEVDVKRIVGTNPDSERITKSDDGMSHYGPHHFVPVEGVLVCPECGAINADGEVEP